jgi:DnaJ-class molecular chaperone
MTDDVKARDAGRSECSPCKGTGRLISNLGGEPHEVVCPWCGGSGKFVPGRDAQESPAEQGK